MLETLWAIALLIPRQRFDYARSDAATYSRKGAGSCQSAFGAHLVEAGLPKATNMGVRRMICNPLT